MQVPPQIDLFYLALDHGNVQLRDGALEFHTDYWSVRLPVSTSQDDEDGLLNEIALYAAQRARWSIRCARQELRIGDWARFWRTEHDPGAGFYELLGPTRSKTAPVDVGVNATTLHRLVAALGSKGPIVLTFAGPRKPIRIRPLPLTDEPAWDAFVMPYKVR